MENEHKPDDRINDQISDTRDHARAEIDLRQGKILFSGDGAVLMLGWAVIVVAFLWGIKSIVEVW